MVLAGSRSAAGPLPAENARVAVAVDTANASAVAPRLALDQLRGWLDLDEIIHDSAIELFSRNGLTVPPAQNNRSGPDGRPIFGRPLKLVRAFFERIAEVERRFQYADDHGARWWVKLFDDPSGPNSWHGVALGGDALPWLVTSRGRERFRAQLDQEYAQLSTPSAASEETQSLRSENRSHWRSMALMDGAVLMLPAIYQVAIQNNQRQTQIAGGILAATWWGADRTSWPHDWLANVHNAIATLMNITIGLLQIPKTGCPYPIVQQRPAISCAVSKKDEILRLQLDREFIAFLRNCVQQTTANASRGVAVEAISKKSDRESLSRDCTPQQSPNVKVPGSRNGSLPQDHMGTQGAETAISSPTDSLEQTMTTQNSRPNQQAKPVPQGKPGSHAESNAPPVIKPDPQSKPDTKAKPQSKPDQKPDALQQAITRCHQEAHIVERALPAVILGVMSAKHLGKVVTPGGYEAYLAKLIAERGEPQDAIERMLLEQLVWSHCRIGNLHVQAACTETPQLNVAYSLAAAKLMSEHRKTSVALKEYRRPLTSPQTLAGNQKQAPVKVNEHPQKPAAKNGDTKQGTKSKSITPVSQADRCTLEPSKAPRLDGRRPPKTSRNGHRKRALAALNGSANGRG